jgi:hypothetical protein
LGTSARLARSGLLPALPASTTTRRIKRPARPARPGTFARLGLRNTSRRPAQLVTTARKGRLMPTNTLVWPARTTARLARQVSLRVLTVTAASTARRRVWLRQQGRAMLARTASAVLRAPPMRCALLVRSARRARPLPNRAHRGHTVLSTASVPPLACATLGTTAAALPLFPTRLATTRLARLALQAATAQKDRLHQLCARPEPLLLSSMRLPKAIAPPVHQDTNVQMASDHCAQQGPIATCCTMNQGVKGQQSCTGHTRVCVHTRRTC